MCWEQDERLDTKVLMAWSACTVVLAFRGTASLANAWSDLKVWLPTCISAPEHADHVLPGGICMLWRCHSMMSRMHEP